MGLLDDGQASLDAQEAEARRRAQEESALDTPYREDWTVELVGLLKGRGIPLLPAYTVEKERMRWIGGYASDATFWGQVWALSGRAWYRGADYVTARSVLLTPDGTLWEAYATLWPAFNTTRRFIGVRSADRRAWLSISEPRSARHIDLTHVTDLRRLVGVSVAAAVARGDGLTRGVLVGVEQPAPR